MNEESNEWVYIIQAIPQGIYKIGRANNLESRLLALQSSNHCELRVTHKFTTSKSREAEKALHAIFEDKKVRGEWYSLSSIDLAFISQMQGYNASFVWENTLLFLDDIKSSPLNLFSVIVKNMMTSTGQLKDITLTEVFIMDFLNRAWRRQKNNKNGLASRFWIRTPHKKIASSHYNAIIKLLDQSELILDRGKRYSGKLAMSPTECLSFIKQSSKGSQNNS